MRCISRFAVVVIVLVTAVFAAGVSANRPALTVTSAADRAAPRDRLDQAFTRSSNQRAMLLGNSPRIHGVVVHGAATPKHRLVAEKLTAAGRIASRTSIVNPSRARTGWPALDRAINQIRTYYPGIAHWHVGDKGSWGYTYPDTGDIYIAPRTPLDMLLSIVEHEYMHALVGHVYGGFTPAESAADRLFGQVGFMGLEIEADCMARVDGATWTGYTQCADPAWRATAAILLTGRRL